MFELVLNRLAQLTFGLAFVCVIAAILTGLAATVFRSRQLATMVVVGSIMRRHRNRHYLNRGFRLRMLRLRREARAEARQLIDTLARECFGSHSLGIRWVNASYKPLFQDARQIRDAISEVVPDYQGDERADLYGELCAVDPRVDQYVTGLLHLLGGLFSLATVILVGRDILAGVGYPMAHLNQLGWLAIGGAATVAGAIIVETLLRLTGVFERHHGVKPIRPGKKPDPEPVDEIGDDDDAIRTLNFSGGYFDTVMQLGTAHALLVIQGKAPDAVVGVSAGALQAVMLAEVMQAGEREELEHYQQSSLPEMSVLLGKERRRTLWRALDSGTRCELHERRMSARVAQLRFFIDKVQTAPEQLVEALLPDFYQTESSHALAPLTQPRFFASERNERTDALMSKAGLVRLYNDLLGIPFSIGTMTRVVRRVLGYSAAREIPSWPLRYSARLVELMRLWVLIGSRLLRIGPVARVLGQAFRSKSQIRIAGAGTLIFRFRSLLWTVTILKNAAHVVLLAVLWTGVGTLPATAWVVTGHEAFLGLYLLPLIAWSLLLAAGPGYEQTTIVDAVEEVSRVTLTFSLTLLAWTLALTAATALISQALHQSGLSFLSPVQPVGDWQSALMAFQWLWVIVVAAAVVLVLNVWLHPKSFLLRWLDSYGLGRSLFSSHGLKLFLSETIDQAYAGGIDMDDVVDSALAYRRQASSESVPDAKTLGRYSAGSRLEPIHVGVAVADLSDGKIQIVHPQEKVVDALTAAVSITPLFEPARIQGRDDGKSERLYVDGSNITNEPIRALMSLLRRKVNRRAKVIHIYSVSSLPVSQPEFGPTVFDRDDDEGTSDPDRPYLNLVDVAIRAMRLQRYRDAALERRLTELYTRVIPPDQFAVTLENCDRREREYSYRAWVTPVELERDLDLNRRILWSGKDRRYAAICETIADGCRAALQVMIASAIEETGRDAGERGYSHRLRLRDMTGDIVAPCRAVVERHLAEEVHRSRDVDAEVAAIPLPGSDPELGPGLREICRHCRLWRDGRPETAPERDPPVDDAVEACSPQHLRLGDWSELGPSWPHERSSVPVDLATDPHFEKPDSEQKQRVLASLATLREHQAGLGRRWPAYRDDETPPANIPEGTALCQRPTISVLFSGGVFRGVHQMGVLNGLSCLGIRPDMIAGASVGSIAGAMAASSLGQPNPHGPDGFSGRDPEGARFDQRLAIARLAAIFLAVDRIILTDRFADFVRELTLRAADTSFSIRDLDLVLRKYDYPPNRAFARKGRRLIAGVERLFYLNPFQLVDLVRAFRERDLAGASNQLRIAVQQLLDRMRVGDEVLGAEALETLIHEYVARGHQVSHFDDVRDKLGIQLLATATNLTRGRLEILGEEIRLANERTQAPRLVAGLLTSSAFPGVFKPRWSWELFPGTRHVDQYIDGGVIDNLPLDTVAQFLVRAADASLVSHVPVHSNSASQIEVPHLVIAASLEENPRPYALVSTRKMFANDWMATLRRVKEHRYNTKLDIYQLTEARLRALRSAVSRDSSFQALDMEVVAIKPEWLCGTFAFHPMLGYRRAKQARSIAHGCASTLLKFGQLKRQGKVTSYFEAWGIDADAVPDFDRWSTALGDEARVSQSRQEGLCWLNGKPCPFSRPALEAANEHRANQPEMSPETIKAVSAVHEECSNWHSHFKRA